MADVQFNNNADVIFADTDVIWIHNVPVLTTQAGTELAADSFTGNATITDHGGENASRRGFCFTYDVTGDPTTADNVVYADGDFNAEAYFLSVAIDTGKPVRYRAYAVNNMGVGYGDTVQVLTLVIADPLVSLSGLEASPGYQLSADPLVSLSGLEATLLCQLSADPLVSLSSLEATLLNQLSVNPDPLASLSGLEASLLCQLSVDPLVSLSGLEASPGYQLSADPLASLSGLEASLLCQLSVDPLVSQGLLSATGVLSFVNTEEFTLTFECAINNIILPIKSFSARFSTESKSQVSVVIPGLDHADLISDTVIDNYNAGKTILGRLSVFIVKTYSSGNVVRERISDVILEDVGYTEDVTIGAIKEITLSGTVDESWSAKTITLSGASYRSIDGGYKSYRCSPDLYVRPGDTVLINGDSFMCNSISWYIDPEQEQMTISEKAA